MKTSDLKTPEELEQFLLGNQHVAFAVLGNKTERYNFIRKMLVKMRSTTLCKKQKGFVIRYLIKMTDYSRQQITRLTKQYIDTGRIH